MKEITIREVCGDYALDLALDNGHTFVFYFNSRQNALTVKRIIEVDMSVPNAATVCDMQEVVRCKDCKSNPNIRTLTKGMLWCRKFRAEVHPNDFCSYGERKGGANNGSE